MLLDYGRYRNFNWKGPGDDKAKKEILHDDFRQVGGPDGRGQHVDALQLGAAHEPGKEQAKHQTSLPGAAEKDAQEGPSE